MPRHLGREGEPGRADRAVPRRAADDVRRLHGVLGRRGGTGAAAGGDGEGHGGEESDPAHDRAMVASSRVERICVFCGANTGTAPVYGDTARALAETLVRRGLGVVYGGGAVGLMGILADAALAAGGEVVGVIPQHLVDQEVGHRGLADLRVVGSMHERKALMAELADGFVALPGGWGTLEELIEVLTWAQLGLHGKPVGLLNAAGYFDPLLAFRDDAVAAGFVRPEHRDLLLVEDNADALLDRFAAYAPPAPRYGGEPPPP